jgi:hypothetical protein
MRRRPRSPSANPDAPDDTIAVAPESATPHPVRGPRYRFRPASEVVLVDDGDDPVVVLELLSPRAAAAALARADELLADTNKTLAAGDGSDDQGKEMSFKGGATSPDANRDDAQKNEANFIPPGSLLVGQRTSDGSSLVNVDRKIPAISEMPIQTTKEPAASAANRDAVPSSGQHFHIDGANDVEMLPRPGAMPEAQHLGPVPQSNVTGPDAPSSLIRPTGSSAGESTESDAEPLKPVLYPQEHIQDSLELRSRHAKSNGHGVSQDVRSSRHQIASDANLGRQAETDPSRKSIGEARPLHPPMVQGPGLLRNGQNEFHGIFSTLNGATPDPSTRTRKQIGASPGTAKNGVDSSCEQPPSTPCENIVDAVVQEMVDETMIATDMDCQTPDVPEDDLCTDDELPYLKRQALRKEESRRKEVILEMVAEREFKIRKEMLESLQVFPPYVDSSSSSSRDSNGCWPSTASQSRVEHILRFRAKHGMVSQVPPIAPILPSLSELAASAKVTSDTSGISIERMNDFCPNRLAAIRRFRNKYRSRLGKVDSAIPPAAQNFVIWALDARQAPCPCGKGICARGSSPSVGAADESGSEPNPPPPVFGSLLQLSQDEMVWETI